MYIFSVCKQNNMQYFKIYYTMHVFLIKMLFSDH